MITAKDDWQVQSLAIDSDIKTLAQELKITPLLVAILKQRGLKTSEQIQDFLNPRPEDLRDPFLLHDMKKAVDRITQSINKGEKITIYGDYDADGITSTAILYEALTEVGAEVNYYIPDRFTDGYGPNPQVFKKLIDQGTQLIITVDNGIIGNESIDMANKLGCDVIISDHHDLPPQLPNAYAIIHARYPGAEYPFGDFSGAGIAFKIAHALIDEIPQDALDLATIGTIADVVSLTDENRVIVKYGFKALKVTPRPGLLALIKNAGLSGQNINEHQIAFLIAPRLNALGRMGDANIGVELLTTIDPDRGKELADLTEKQNKERQQLVKTITKEADAQVQADLHTPLLVSGEDWHEGVLGIVASRLVDKYHRPTLVLTHKGNYYKGSGRSIAGFNLFKALNGFRDHLDKFGGHEMAVGLTINENNLTALKDYLSQLHLRKTVSKRSLKIVGKVALSQIDMNFYQDLKQMAPFGTDNEEPIFEVIPESISSVVTMGKNHDHLKFVANQDNQHLPVIAFRRADLSAKLRQFNGAVMIVGKLDLNEWRGNVNLQLLMEDIKSDGVDIIDKRCKTLTRSMFTENTHYIFFNPLIAKQVQPFINDPQHLVLADQLGDKDRFDQVAIVDLPDQIELLQQVLKQLQPRTITLYLYYKRSKLIIPNRQVFATFYQWLLNHPNFNLHQHFQILKNSFKIDANLIIFMLKVFNELNFVKITDGVVSVSTNPPHQALESAAAYQNRQQRRQTAQVLLTDQRYLFSLINDCLKRTQ